jgi:hypothetical protein
MAKIAFGEADCGLRNSDGVGVDRNVCEWRVFGKCEHFEFSGDML